jgi:hypothetical protein
MVALLDWAHGPLAVHLVLPVTTAYAVTSLTSTANLLCPMHADVLNMRSIKWPRCLVPWAAVCRLVRAG